MRDRASNPDPDVSCDLQAKANPNMANNMGETPMHRAAHKGEDATVAALLKVLAG